MKRLFLALVLLLGNAIQAMPQFAPPPPVVPGTDCSDQKYGCVQGPGGWYRAADRSGPYVLDATCTGTLAGTISLDVGAGTILTNQITITTTATQIVASRIGRRAVILASLGSNPLYIGAAGVTTSTGMLLPQGTMPPLAVPATSAIYGIMSSGTQVVSVLEVF